MCTNKLYLCLTNRMLALNSKNLNFHFEKQSGTIIGKKILLLQHVNLKIHFCSQGIKVTEKVVMIYISVSLRLLFLIFLYQYFSIYSCALSFVNENSFMIFFIVSSLLTLNFFDILIVPLISPS